MIEMILPILDVVLSSTIENFGEMKNAAGKDDTYWMNASQELIFGEKTEWAIGLGHTTNSFGNKIDLNVDFSYWISEWLDKKISGGLGDKIGAAIMGCSGYYNFTLGPMTSITYGATDLSLQRKNAADQQFEIIDEKGKVPLLIKFTCGVTILAMLSAMIAVRANTLSGFINKNNKESVDTTNKIIIAVVNAVEPRFLAILAKMELALHAKHYLEKTIAEVSTAPKYIKKILSDGIEAAKDAAEGVLKRLRFNDSAKQELEKAKNDINGYGVAISDTLDKQISFVGGVVDLFQDNRPDWYETNKKYGLMCERYLLTANGSYDEKSSKATPGKIQLGAQSYEFTSSAPGSKPLPTKVKTQSEMLIKDDSIAMKTFDDSKLVASFDLDDSAATLVGKSIRLKSANDINKDCGFEFLNGDVNILCGIPKSGPSITMKGSSPEEIVVSVGTSTLSSSITIKKDEITIGHNGPVQQPMFRPLITITDSKIELSAGITSIFLEQTGITMQSGQSTFKVDPNGITQLSALISSQALMKTTIDSIITAIKTEGPESLKAAFKAIQ